MEATELDVVDHVIPSSSGIVRTYFKLSAARHERRREGEGGGGALQNYVSLNGVVENVSIVIYDRGRK